jgi:hypothetical protein
VPRLHTRGIAGSFLAETGRISRLLLQVRIAGRDSRPVLGRRIAATSGKIGFRIGAWRHLGVVPLPGWRAAADAADEDYQ